MQHAIAVPIHDTYCIANKNETLDLHVLCIYDKGGGHIVHFKEMYLSQEINITWELSFVQHPIL